MIFGVFIAMGLGLVVARQFSPTEAEAQALTKVAMLLDKAR